jgi:hypothetical protein
MSFFGDILDKLGMSGARAASAGEQSTTPAAQPAETATVPDGAATPPGAPSPIAMSVVDVKARLEALAAAHPQKLNWRTSIADLLRLLDIDNSYSARKELAIELGCPEELMGDSAQMNMWLHKSVLQKIADNGGNIPADLLN